MQLFSACASLYKSSELAGDGVRPSCSSCELCTHTTNYQVIFLSTAIMTSRALSLYLSSRIENCAGDVGLHGNPTSSDRLVRKKIEDLFANMGV